MQPDPKKVDELVRRIVEVAHPLRIILFGSAARGEMKPDSDIDVLIVVPEGTHRRQTAQKIYRHMIGFPLAVDVVVVTESDLHKYKDNFSLVYYPALRKGKEIYAAEPPEIGSPTENNQPVARLIATTPGRPKRKLGTLKGTVLYMAPDFDAPLEDFKEYME